MRQLLGGWCPRSRRSCRLVIGAIILFAFGLRSIYLSLAQGAQAEGMPYHETRQWDDRQRPDKRKLQQSLNLNCKQPATYSRQLPDVRQFPPSKGFLPHQPVFNRTPASLQRPWRAFEYYNGSYGLGRENAVVSIVVPFYGAERFSETLVSIQRQSLQQFELLVVNDASPVPELRLRSLLQAQFAPSDPRVVLITHQSNKGLSAARNTGFRNARTPYVLMIDTDDLIEPTALEKCYWLLRTQPSAGFVKGFTVGFGALNYTWSKGFRYKKEFLDHNTASEVSMIRRSVWEQVSGFDETMKTGLEDYDFWLRAANHGHWGATISEVIDWYRRKSDVQSAADWPAFVNPPNFREKYSSLYRNGMPDYEFKTMPTVIESYETRVDTAGSGLEQLLPLPRRHTSARVMIVTGHLGNALLDPINLGLVKSLTGLGQEVTVIATDVVEHHKATYSFASLTPDVFCLSHFLGLKDFLPVVLHLLRSRQPDLVIVHRSSWAAAAIPTISAELPALHMVELLSEPSNNHAGGERWLPRSVWDFVQYSIQLSDMVEEVTVTEVEEMASSGNGTVILLVPDLQGIVNTKLVSKFLAKACAQAIDVVVIPGAALSWFQLDQCPTVSGSIGTLDISSAQALITIEPHTVYQRLIAQAYNSALLQLTLSNGTARVSTLDGQERDLSDVLFVGTDKPFLRSALASVKHVLQVDARPILHLACTGSKGTASSTTTAEEHAFAQELLLQHEVAVARRAHLQDLQRQASKLSTTDGTTLRAYKARLTGFSSYHPMNSRLHSYVWPSLGLRLVSSSVSQGSLKWQIALVFQGTETSSLDYAVFAHLINSQVVLLL